MLDVVIGRARNLLGQQQLQEALKPAELEGTLYLAYPIIASSDQMITVDSLLTTEQHGVVIIDFPQSANESSEQIRDRQDDLYNALKRKLLQFKPLLDRRELSVPIHVLTFIPDDTAVAQFTDVDVASPGTLLNKLHTYPAISYDQLKQVNAAIQRVSTIKPTTKRSNVVKADSRGAIMQRMEREVANLDQWQKRAAIETPDGPQRVRGLAGSGKTIVLALKAAYLHALNPEWNIVVTFSTRALYQQFKDLIRRFCFEHKEDEPDWTKLRIMHAWGSVRQAGVYSEIAKANDLEVRDFAYARLAFSYETAFEGVCDELLASLAGKQPQQLFDAVLVDEAQDLPRSFFELCFLATKDPKRIVYAYDELQNLGSYSMVPPSELFGNRPDGLPNVRDLENADGMPRRDIILPVCYRNTPWALTTAHAVGFGIYRRQGLVQFFENPHLLEEIGYRVCAGELESGKDAELERAPNSYPAYFSQFLDRDDSVIWRSFKDQLGQAEWVAAEIQRNIGEDELKHTDILVVIPNALKAREESVSIVKSLSARGIAAHLVGVTSSVDSIFQENSIAISGIYRAKGNEAAIVYILNSEYAKAPFISVRARNALFTAITRSRAWVRLCGIGDGMDSLIEELQNVKQKQYRLAFRVPSEDELKRMRKIHRDMTDSEIAKQKAAIKNIRQILSMAESGELILDAIPEDLKRRLGDMLEQPNDPE